MENFFLLFKILLLDNLSTQPGFKLVLKTPRSRVACCITNEPTVNTLNKAKEKQLGFGNHESVSVPGEEGTCLYYSSNSSHSPRIFQP